MSEEMKKAFEVLDINTKRKKLSEELMMINELIKNFDQLNGLFPLNNVKSYKLFSLGIMKWPPS